MRDLSVAFVEMAGAVNIQREAISILLNRPPTEIQVQIALANAAQKLKDLGLDKVWDEEHLDAYHAGIDKTVSLLSESILKASLKGAPNLPPSLKT